MKSWNFGFDFKRMTEFLKINRQGRIANQKGLTLVEIMIVLSIIGGLMALLAPRIQANLNKSKIRQARLQIGELGKALDMYYADCGAYPTTDQGLNVLLEAPASGCSNWGPDAYIKKNLLKDPWNGEFIYEQTASSYVLRSLGKDRREGGTGVDADIASDDEDRADAEKSEKN